MQRRLKSVFKKGYKNNTTTPNPNQIPRSERKLDPKHAAQVIKGLIKALEQLSNFIMVVVSVTLWSLSSTMPGQWSVFPSAQKTLWYGPLHVVMLIFF